MATRRLSDRALMILRHIADRSTGGTRWLPGGARGMDDYDKPSGTYLNICGSGDASILRALVRSGLLERNTPKSGCSTQYHWLLATPTGIARLEAEAERIAMIRNYLAERAEQANQLVRKLVQVPKTELGQKHKQQSKKK
jgi:hypothetical protein